MAEWCQENNLSLNVNKTKELIVAFRKQQREHAPIHIDVTAEEIVENFKLFSAHCRSEKVHPHRQCGEEGNSPSSTSGGRRNLAWPLKPSQTFTDAQLRASMLSIESIHHRVQTACPPGHLHQTMSQEGQKRSSTTQATACSPHYHPEGEVSTGASKLRLKNSFSVPSQGHQTVK